MTVPLQPRVSRRHLLAGTGGAIASGTLSGGATAQPAATPGSGITLDDFRVLCEQVTGIAPIEDDAGLTELIHLMATDDQFAAGIQELLALEGAAFDPYALSMPGLVTVTNILQFWYLGNFMNEPLANRDERFPELLSWQALPYVTNQTVCKGLGYWATEPELPPVN